MIKAGSSFFHNGKRGTIGAVIVLKGVLYMITVSHIFRGEGDRLTVNGMELVVTGILKDYDLALIELPSGTAAEITEFGSPAGKIPIRTGFKMYEDGRIESVEPAKPIPVETPIGLINAYDATALGIDADTNSLGFDRNGRLTALSTFDIISVKTGSGEKRVTFPKLKPGLTDDYEKVPIKLRFGEDSVTIDDGKQTNEYRISDTTFKITGGDYTETTSCDDCSQCKICF